jgi:hypothetical protein
MLAHGQSKMAIPNTGINIQEPIINQGLIHDLRSMIWKLTAEAVLHDEDLL